MRFFIQVTGSHNEGRESAPRFNKMVNDLLAALGPAGFFVDNSFADLDFGADTDATFAEQAAVLTVKFASAAAAKLADEHNLTDTDFAGVSASSAQGFLADDVRDVIKAKN